MAHKANQKVPHGTKIRAALRIVAESRGITTDAIIIHKYNEAFGHVVFSMRDGSVAPAIRKVR